MSETITNMNMYSIQNKSSEYAMLNSRELFSDLCARMTENIIQLKTIQESALLDFSRMTVSLLSHGIDGITESFENLSRHVSNYRRYQFNRETDLNRGYSYIRLFQMMSMVSYYHEEREQEYKAHNAMSHEYDYVISCIKKSPGITYKNLNDAFWGDCDELNKQLKTLEKQGFVIGNREGEERFYLLSEVGDALYRNLHPKNYSKRWVGQWNGKRIELYALYLLFARELEGYDGLIHEITEKFSLINEWEVDFLHSQMVKLGIRRLESPLLRSLLQFFMDNESNANDKELIVDKNLKMEINIVKTGILKEIGERMDDKKYLSEKTVSSNRL